jgi:hypothetical protein
MEVSTPRRSLQGAVALLYALYYIVGGIWAVIGRRSFEAVTGPKVDYWLVRCVGGLLTVIGATVALSHLRARGTPEIRFLAIGASGVLTTIDIVGVARGRIRAIYLLDAVVNLGLIAGWLWPDPASRSSVQARSAPRSR